MRRLLRSTLPVLARLGALLAATSTCATPPSEPDRPAGSPRPNAGELVQTVTASASADFDSASALGLELQAYPAGIIAGLHAEWALGERDVLSARLAWNETDRGDFGEHDDEQGGGPGGGLGWRRFFGPELTGWLLGGRLDLWSLEIDWEDDAPAAAQGTTDVLVLQPSLEGGYRWRLGSSGWRLDLTGSFGFEINVDSDGEDVGEGPIGLLGAVLSYGL